MGGEVLCGSSVYFWIYAGILESSCISSGRRPSITDFAGSARGAFFAGIAAALLGASPAEGADSDAILI